MMRKETYDFLKKKVYLEDGFTPDYLSWGMHALHFTVFRKFPSGKRFGIVLSSDGFSVFSHHIKQYNEVYEFDAEDFGMEYVGLGWPLRCKLSNVEVDGISYNPLIFHIKSNRHSDIEELYELYGEFRKSLKLVRSNRSL